MLHELLERWILDTRASGGAQSSHKASSVLQASKSGASCAATEVQWPTPREQLLREVKNMECIVEGVRGIFMILRSAQSTDCNTCADSIDIHDRINATDSATVTGGARLWLEDQAGAA